MGIPHQLSLILVLSWAVTPLVPLSAPLFSTILPIPPEAAGCCRLIGKSQTCWVGVGVHHAFETVQIWLQTQRKPSVHVQDTLKLQDLDLPTGSKRTCPEKADGLKPCPGMLSVRIHAHDGETSLRKPGKVSVMPDLSARGAVSHMEEPERPGSNGCIRHMHMYAAEHCRQLKCTCKRISKAKLLDWQISIQEITLLDENI